MLSTLSKVVVSLLLFCSFNTTVKALTYSPNGTSGLNLVYNGGIDDGFLTVSLPWTINFLGSNYSTVYVGTNGYITFSSGNNTYYSFSPSNPGGPHISIIPGDRILTKLYYAQINAGTPQAKFVIRVEGYDYSNAGITHIYEVHFYSGQSYYDIYFVDSPSSGNQNGGTSAVSNGSSYTLTYSTTELSGIRINSNGTIYIDTPQSGITNSQQTIVNTTKSTTGSGVYINQAGSGVNISITQQGPNNLIKGQDLSAAAQILGDYNSLTVNQNTSGNVLGIDVNGNNNTIDITQNKNQRALVGITGSSNSLTMEQQIFGVSGEHFAKINIEGNSNTVDTSQKDSGDKILFTDIQGSNNTVDIKQWGTGQHFLDLTLGDSNTINVIQDGLGSHNATVNLSGNPTTLNLTQDASTNQNYYLQQLCTTATCSATVTQQ
jgi:hypothetical protein